MGSSKWPSLTSGELFLFVGTVGKTEDDCSADGAVSFGGRLSFLLVLSLFRNVPLALGLKRETGVSSFFGCKFDSSASIGETELSRCVRVGLHTSDTTGVEAAG